MRMKLVVWTNSLKEDLEIFSARDNLISFSKERLEENKVKTRGVRSLTLSWRESGWGTNIKYDRHELQKYLRDTLQRLFRSGESKEEMSHPRCHPRNLSTSSGENKLIMLAKTVVQNTEGGFWIWHFECEMHRVLRKKCLAVVWHSH